MSRFAPILAATLSVCSLLASAQQTDTTLNDITLHELDSILTQEDSLSIFNLIDSLLQVSDVNNTSSLAVRLGYNSNAASNNRSLGINQFGLSPGASYYHKSGAYLDVSGYWSTEYNPGYYLTILSAGYIGVISKHWSFLGEYSRYLYSDLGDSVTISYKNSVGLSNFIDVKPFTFRLDYTLLFGEKTGHRIMPGVMLNLQKKNWKNIDRVLFYPSFNLLFGSEQYERLVPYERTLLGNLIRIRNGLPLYYEETGTDFGVLNYSFTAPLSIRVKNWNFLLSYTYNIPKLLSNEVDVGITNSGFVAASITRYFRFK